jgi:hypothetical protein
VDMADGWTMRDACALQSALRLSNQAFAARLGIGLRTVADWHGKNPDLRPVLETKQLLDTLLEQAPLAVRERSGSGSRRRAPACLRGLRRLAPAETGRRFAGSTTCPPPPAWSSLTGRKT